MLDASLALAWCFRDEATPYANSVLSSLRDTRAIVPALWVYEVENALVTGVRKKRTSEKGARTFRELLAVLPIDIQPPPAFQSESAEALHATAVEQNLSAYDAAYLALAIEFGIPLATLDGTGRRQGLKQAAQRLKVDLYTPSPTR